MMLVDAHCHLEPDDYPDVPAVIARARAAGVVRAVVVGQFQRPGEFGKALEVARAHPDFLVATVGIHPHDAALATESDWGTLERLCASDEVKAVGEGGLDYYYDRSPREVQRESLGRQAALAKRLAKPLVVHVRDAHHDCQRILAESGVRSGVIHCFTAGTDAARAYLELGFHISIAGVVTYKKTEDLQNAVRFTPVDRLLVETDSPFLAPVPHRGRKNEPAYVVETARRLAELKAIPLEELARSTSENAARVFGFNLPA
jgi:TatD DNase family protein